MQYENGSDEYGARWRNFAATFKGPLAPTVVLVLVFTGAVAWMQYAFMESVRKLDEKRAIEHQRIAESMDTMSWIVSLPQERRPELTPPESIWRRLKAQTYEELERERTRPSTKTHE